MTQTHTFYFVLFAVEQERQRRSQKKPYLLIAIFIEYIGGCGYV